MKKTTGSWLLFTLVLSLGSGTSSAAQAAVLLSDDYQALTPGMLSGGVIGARIEYHYLSAAAPKGNWAVATFRTDASQRAWRLIEENGERLIWQSYTETDRERPYTHPMIIAGDELWTDYTLDVRFAPENDRHQSGVVFRYHTNRVYYFAGVIGQKAVIKKINNGVAFRKMDETILAESPLAWKPGEFLSLKVTAEGDKLTADFGSGVKLEARDAAFKHGKIGFTSDVPTKFAKVTVTCSEPVKAAFEKARQAREDEETKLQSENPKMVVWKKIYTPGFGAGRNLRFGDLDGDGQTDILVVQQHPHGPSDGHSEVGCMTALTLDGKRLWQVGRPDSWHDDLTNDVGVQIHDFDGDGKAEVVYCRDMEIVVADGATGHAAASLRPARSLPAHPRRLALFLRPTRARRSARPRHQRPLPEYLDLQR
jgi:rhamnogalacturonan endolyase